MNMLSLLLTDPWVFVAILLAFLVSLSVHEFSHALAAQLLGDSTAARMNRLTLNPFAHIDPWGLVSLLLIGFGWGKPVPYNPYNLRNARWGPTIIALAGPCSNLVLGLCLSILGGLIGPHLGETNLLVIFLFYGAILNFSLMIFNLIPVSPLDGAAPLLALFDLLKWREGGAWLMRYGSTVLLALVLLEIVFNVPVFSWISEASFFLVNAIVSALS